MKKEIKGNPKSAFNTGKSRKMTREEEDFFNNMNRLLILNRAHETRITKDVIEFHLKGE